MKTGTDSRMWTFEEALAIVCDESQEISRSMIAFLSGAGRTQVAHFADCWRRMPPERRRELVDTMVEMAEADFEMDFNAIFRWALRSEDPAVRERAIEGLWEDDQPGLVDPLVRIMQSDPQPAVRAQAATSLGRFALAAELGDLPDEQASRVRQALLAVIDKAGEAPDVRRRAIESVAYLSDAPVREIVNQAYASEDEETRLSAVFAMGRTADPHWAAPVRRELGAADAAMRYEAARAAGEIGLRQAVGELIRLLNDPDAEVQEMAIWALGQIGGEQARRALEVCRASPRESVRDAAEEAMAELDFASAPLDILCYDAGGATGAEGDEERAGDA